MPGICTENFFVAFRQASQHPRLLESIQFDSDGIRTFAELLFQVAQISLIVTVQEELKQQLDARFRRNERVNHY